jgi:uncharacterized short protein YbdD (DUF466 family)
MKRDLGRYAALWAGAAQMARLMVGIPDYDTYVAHRRATHPEAPVMTYEEFFAERQAARYSAGNGRFRCC